MVEKNRELIWAPGLYEESILARLTDHNGEAIYLTLNGISDNCKAIAVSLLSSVVVMLWIILSRQATREMIALMLARKTV